MSELKFEFEKKTVLDKGTVLDIITTGLEGGIGYWACLCNDRPEWSRARKLAREELLDTPCYCDVVYKMFELGLPVVFEDAEDEEEHWELTFEKFLNGCKMYEEKMGKSIVREINNCNFDAEDADLIFQYALFNEVVFG